jgi:hypothetical protein
MYEKAEKESATSEGKSKPWIVEGKLALYRYEVLFVADDGSVFVFPFGVAQKTIGKRVRVTVEEVD